MCLHLTAASSSSKNVAAPVSVPSETQALPADMDMSDVEEFMTMTPKKYKEKTGKRMGVKQAIQMKMAQKMAKKADKASKGGDIPQGLYIVLAIFGLAWIGMGVMDDWQGDNWWINLILSLLFVIPGLIHALIKMGDYY
jgi:uncharacterized membrane protein YqaE (UPF0057 family)